MKHWLLSPNHATLYPLPGVMPLNSPRAVALGRVLDSEVVPFLC